MSFPPLEVIENKFYFGLGGMGDFLLLMSTFYDNIESNTDVIFVCNNVNTIKEMSELFPMVNRFWFYPRKAFFISEPLWESIVSHDLCLGTGVTPAKFDYVRDWIKCGKTNVFLYYGVKENPMFASPTQTADKYIVIQRYGGGDDPTKKKELPADFLNQITIKAHEDGNKVIFMGSRQDAENMPLNRWALESGQARWVINISNTFNAIRGCEAFYGTDSWGKTVACLAGKKTIVYPNQYEEGRKPMDLFNHPVDPSDYVFLEGWKIRMALCL